MIVCITVSNLKMYMMMIFKPYASFVDNAGDTDEHSNDMFHDLSVLTALIKALIRKSTGINNLPSEILKKKVPIFENAVCEIAAILSRPKCVKS